MQDRFKFRYVFKKDFGGKTGICYKMPIFNLDTITDENFNKIVKSYIDYDYKLISIEQCTGLKDKNGKLIYEGDIIKYFCPAEYCSDGLHKCPECYSGENGSVHYDEDLAMYEYRSKSDECPLTDNINTEEDLEIIGNIYENQELLKEG